MASALIRKSDNGRRFSVKELICGLLVLAVGLAFMIGSYDLDFGSSEQMGPGFFPVLAGGVTLVIGLAIMLGSLSKADTRFQEVPWRPMFAVGVSVAAFAIFLNYFGLFPAVMGCVIFSAFGDRTSRPFGVIVLAVVGAVGAWLIFSVGLGLPLYAFQGVD
ncbi:hypothetical protein FACS1894158_05500 [Betaproteobacteria bacterium]|nr:hypothetical protein FACS1894158_05500 [Betaproteobacteria bacterium]